MLCCPLCRIQYDDARRLPMLGLCGHTICAICRSNLVRRQCPVSLRCSLVKYSFLFPAVNYTIQEHVEIVKNYRNELHSNEQVYPKRNVNEVKQELLGNHREEEQHNNEKIKLLTKERDKLKARANDLGNKVINTGNSKCADTVQCSNCKEYMANWLAMCCVTCTEGLELSNSDVMITDLEKIKAQQLCGNCILDSDHKTHPFDTILAFQARQLIQEKLRDQLEIVKNLEWPSHENGKIHYQNLRRLVTDSAYCRSLQQVDEIIQNVQTGVQSILQMHRKALENSSMMEVSKIHRKGLAVRKTLNNVRSHPFSSATMDSTLSRRSNRLRSANTSH
ncbi:unnamed protein product [Auanema sp. JU1783]|nr:unnamed protein product [Auanema sp. JU1783]